MPKVSKQRPVREAGGNSTEASIEERAKAIATEFLDDLSATGRGIYYELNRHDPEGMFDASIYKTVPGEPGRRLIGHIKYEVLPGLRVDVRGWLVEDGIWHDFAEMCKEHIQSRLRGESYAQRERATDDS